MVNSSVLDVKTAEESMGFTVRQVGTAIAMMAGTSPWTFLERFGRLVDLVVGDPDIDVEDVRALEETYVLGMMLTDSNLKVRRGKESEGLIS